MTISLWRYSHLVLAISSFLFVLVASVTGIILAFEPISNATEPYAVKGFNNIELSSALHVVKQEYDEVLELSVDPNNFVLIDAITKDGKSVNGYINPHTGAFLGDQISKSKLFRVTTNIHRSLFLKRTGRIIVGITSFLLCLIAISGTILIIKRQLKVKRFFSKVLKDNFAQYWHTILGRFFLIPILIITLTGVYLSLFRFNILPDNTTKQSIDYDALNETPKLDISEFDILNGVPLSEVKSVEFPFSNAVDDFYTIIFKDKTCIINQFTGEVVSQTSLSSVNSWANWSIAYHTGQGSIIWSLVLFSACISIVFFVYSGFKMTFTRRKGKQSIKNIYSKDHAEIIILVGSETGHTFRFAKPFYNALLNSGKTVHISNLDTYTTYKEAKHLVVLTSTYGDGEPPINAKKFEEQFKSIGLPSSIKYAVVGFGSMAYKHYCKYAIDVNNILQENTRNQETVELCKINNQAFNTFSNWANQWSKSTGIEVEVSPVDIPYKSRKENSYEVVAKTPLNIDSTFLLRLKPKQKERFKSGDLLSLIPEEDHVERLYSVGKIDDDILLSIKKHEFGICSNYLRSTENNDLIKGKIKIHKPFRFPKRAKEVIMISNGTGIAPFLGMINDNRKHIKTHLFWGGRTKESFSLYKKMINKGLDNKQLSSLHIAYSQEQTHKIYVQDVLKQQEHIIVQTMQNKGVIMICGSVAMQKQVFIVLNAILKSKLNTSVEYLEKKERIKTDCY